MNVPLKGKWWLDDVLWLEEYPIPRLSKGWWSRDLEVLLGEGSDVLLEPS